MFSDTLALQAKTVNEQRYTASRIFAILRNAVRDINRELKHRMAYMCELEWGGILDKVVMEGPSRNITFKFRPVRST